MSGDGGKRAETYAVLMADSVMRRHAPEKTAWHYENGLVLAALLAVGRRTGDGRYARFVKECLGALVDEEGSILGYDLEEYNVDQINPGKLLFEFTRGDDGPRYERALRTLRSQFDGHPRTSNGCYWHKRIYPHQVWLDGLYMQGPFLARWAREFGEPGLFDEVVRELLLTEQVTRDSRTGLLRHAWDESRTQAWSDPETGRSPHVWGRAVGWYAMALVDVLDFIPADHGGTAELREVVRRLADAVARVQDGQSGLWFQILDHPDRTGNYLESSCSSMFVYFSRKAIRLGLLDERRFASVADRGFRGLVREKLRSDEAGNLHLADVCKVGGLGGNPYRDGSFEYYMSEPVVADDYKGVGPFILAALEEGEAGVVA